MSKGKRSERGATDPFWLGIMWLVLLAACVGFWGALIAVGLGVMGGKVIW